MSWPNTIPHKHKRERLIIEKAMTQIIDELFVKHINSIVDKKSKLNKKFKCDTFKFDHYHFDSFGHVGNVHEINLIMKCENDKLTFSLQNRSDDNNYITQSEIKVNDKYVHYYNESHQSYEEESDNDEDNKIIVDTKICKKNELIALNNFFDEIKNVF